MARRLIDRKEFLKSALVLAGAGAGVATLAACGGDSGKGGSGGSNGGGSGGSSGGNACDSHEPMETIATNHAAGSQHTLTVAPADVAAGTDKTYSIQGLSSHDHTITITAAQFTNLQSGMSIMTTSTSSVGHTHVVMVVCG
jgi:hypothetical protein